MSQQFFLLSVLMCDLEPDFGPPPQGKAKKRKPAEVVSSRNGQVMLIFSRRERSSDPGFDKVRFDGAVCVKSDSVRSVSREQLQLHLRSVQDEWLRYFQASRARWNKKQKDQYANRVSTTEATSFVWLLSVHRFRAEGDYVFGKASFSGQQFQPVSSFSNVGLLSRVAGVAADLASGAGPERCTFQEFCETVQCNTAGGQGRSVIIPRSVAEHGVSLDPLDGLLLPEGLAKRLHLEVSGRLELRLQETTKRLPANLVRQSESLCAGPKSRARSHPDILLSVFHGALGHYCQSLADISAIVQLVGDMLLPALSLNVVEDLRVPNYNVVSFYMSKLDLLDTLSRRHFAKGGHPAVRRARYFQDV